MRDAMMHEYGVRKPYIENLNLFKTVLHNKIANSFLKDYVDIKITDKGNVIVNFKPFTIDLSKDDYYDSRKQQMNACKLVYVLNDIDFEWLFENAIPQEDELRDDEISQLYEEFDDYLDEAYKVEFGYQNSVADQIIKNFYIYYGDE